MSFTPTQLVERRKFLGGSEAASALGLSDWYTPLQLYRSKLGEADPIDETIPMMVGTALESVVLSLFEKETGMKVERRQEQVIDADWNVRRATLDGVASDGGIVQAKSSGMPGWWGKGEDHIPPYVIYQTHHEMKCLGASHAHVPVIISQREFKLYRVDRNEELIALLDKGEREFWARVIEKRPPDPIDVDDLKYLFPVDVGTKIVASKEIDAVAHRLADIKAKRKLIEKEEEAAAFEIKKYMGDAQVLTDSRGTPLFTYKGHTENRIDVTSLREERPDIAKLYTKEGTQRRLLCKI